MSAIATRARGSAASRWPSSPTAAIASVASPTAAFWATSSPATMSAASGAVKASGGTEPGQSRRRCAPSRCTRRSGWPKRQGLEGAAGPEHQGHTRHRLLVGSFEHGAEVVGAEQGPLRQDADAHGFDLGIDRLEPIGILGQRRRAIGSHGREHEKGGHAGSRYRRAIAVTRPAPRPCRSRRTTLPMALRGSASTTRYSRGRL